jgi:uncharacterized membrane protein
MSIELTAVLVWWITLVLLGILIYPIMTRVLRIFGDQSYLYTKTFALVLLTYLTWILSHLVSYSTAAIVLALSIMLFCSMLVLRSHRTSLTFELRSVVEGELIFSVIFLFFLLIRAYRPEIGGLDIGVVGEKWMDFAFLNAVGRSDSFPPIDPWFSTKVIDCYYYFGYLVTSIMIKITTINASIAYNLAVATYAALLGSAVYGIAAKLCGKKSCGCIAVLFVLFLGNLGILAPLWIELTKGLNLLQVLTTPNFSYFWIPSRVVPEGITEFPFFTYILGDLHPHLVAMPFQMLVLALLLALFCEKFENTFVLLFLPLCLGFLIPLNSWDYFTYAMLLLGIIAFQIATLGLTMPRLALSGGLILSSLALYLPFFLEFRPKAIEGIALVTGGRTPIYSLVAMFGLFLFLILSWLMAEFGKHVLFKEGAGAKKEDSSNYFIYALIGVGAAAMLIPEVIYFKSGFYSSAFDRGNTIFKLYLPAWLLLGIAAACSACRLKGKIGRKSIRVLFFAFFALLVIISALYPVLAVHSWIGGSAPTLDGIGYMKERDDYRGEYQAIEWLNEHVAGAIIIEAVEDSEHRTDYSRPGRISASTGLQTVIGWPWHELLWRRDKDVWRRVDDVKEIYATDNASRALSLLNRYNVSYVYVGGLEKELYGAAGGLVKFDSNCFDVVYRKEGVILYRVKNDCAAGLKRSN